ncbi:membrane protein involved in D-alanine export [Scopulibacillus daqui]|uniref:Teichoic acid D-alanyltransferase n=1 Tax=Scopulibacillus daqui TaxID=1469162 RepID=A0ABS2PXS6_9BACL|nr:D-alanyl-lipoteichoic acid biosynthesis protein DltB [Scopulibacillus daqui]MBM7644849.1 membrane protein involved in D-alanine export [Scopulibacillus daqui]
MIPYATFLYFFILAILLIPSIIAGLNGKSFKTYNAVITIVFLALIFYNKPPQAISLIIFVIWQIIVIKAYLPIRKKNNPTSIFYLAVALSIIPLVIVKFAPYFKSLSMVGFLGISYLTFKAVQMIIDIRDGQLKEVSVYRFLRFLLFFPTFTSGPIDRYRRFEKDINHTPTQEEYRELLYRGINRIIQGFLYKFIIGYLINQHILMSEYLKHDTFLSIVIYMYAYSMYLFFDFAGYSNFAIGVSYILGIKSPENFNKPFISRNIKDFWNRWHMTLSFWFRDYIFMRFVFTMTKKKVIKNRYTISYIGIFLNFFVMGLWHGPYLHYIVYGLLHTLYFISFDIFERKNKKHKFWPDNKFMHVVSVVITFNFVCFSFLIFSGRLFT